MFESFSIRNFRCFRDFTFGPLQRVNLIAGRNNVGKTSLLEALFLHMAHTNPLQAAGMNVLRGVDQYSPTAMGVWGWLFHGKRTGESIELETRTSDGRTLVLKLYFEPVLEVELAGIASNLGSTGPDSNSNAAGRGFQQLIYEYSEPGKQIVKARAFITPEKEVRAELARPDGWLPPGIFLPAQARPFDESAQRFSGLEKLGREQELVEMLKSVEPRLLRMAIAMSGAKPMIHADIGLGELIPIPYLGEGMVRLLTVVLAIADASGGAVLVDEIENGFHHSILVDVWRAIALAARKVDVQVFATTHSWECIRAAHEAFDTGEAYDFCLHRLEQIEGEIRDIAYDRESLGAALQAEFEVR